MKVFSHLRVLVLLTLACIGATVRSNAQSNIVIAVFAPTNGIAVNSTITYTMFVTNETGIDAVSVVVTNSLSLPVQIVSTNTSQGAILASGNSVVFSLGTVFAGTVANMSLTVRPTTTGTLVNTISLFTPQITTPIIVTHNNQVTNVVTLAALAVSLTPPAQPILPGDFITYGVAVSNQGPSTASGVFLTNTIPASFHFIRGSPATTQFSFTNGVDVINIGTLSNAASKHFTLTVQPTNSGTFTLSAGVGSTGSTNSNASNNVASIQITVTNFIPADLIATNESSMVFNPQDAFMEQTVRLVNVGSNSVPAARVIVSGLTNWLYSAVGTNNGNPFVTYNASLDPGQTVDLLLQYFVPTRTPIAVDNSNYTAVGVPVADLTGATGTNTSFDITRIVPLGDGSLLVEFQATTNRVYTVLYSTDSTFASGVLMAQPSIVAQADRVQWIDSGPPQTVSAPTNSPMRFYRVLLNP